MILTGECKEDFLVWYFNTYLKEDKYYLIKDVEAFFKSVKTTLQNALIIEFFDSVGIYILLKRFTYLLEFNDWYFIITNKQGVHLNSHLECRIKIDSRQEATKQAIVKTNELYNNEKYPDAF